MPTEGFKVSGILHFLRIRLKSGGLSGEHIELCAEGARQMPNLSGKRTETHQPHFGGLLIVEQSFLLGLLFLFLLLSWKEGIL